MEKQVNWRVLSELGSHRPDGGGGKTIRHGRERRRFVSSLTVTGFIYSAIKDRRESRNDGSERTQHTTLGKDALVLSGVPHLLPLSVSPSSPSGSHTWDGAAPLPTLKLLMCFSVLCVWVRQNAKSIMPFLPHFLFDATSKSQWTALQRPTEGKKKPMVRNTLRMKGKKLHPSLS